MASRWQRLCVPDPVSVCRQASALGEAQQQAQAAGEAQLAQAWHVQLQQLAHERQDVTRAAMQVHARLRVGFREALRGGRRTTLLRCGCSPCWPCVAASPAAACWQARELGLRGRACRVQAYKRLKGELSELHAAMQTYWEQRQLGSA